MAITQCRGNRKKRHIGNCILSIELLEEKEKKTLQKVGKEKTMDDTLQLLEAADQWQESVSSLPNMLKEGWIPLLSTVETITEGEKITFIHRYIQAHQERTLPSRFSTYFEKRLQVVFKQLKSMPEVMKFLVRHPEESLRIMFDFKKGSFIDLNPNIDQAGYSGGLNKGFTIQALFAFFQQKNRESFQTEHGPLTLAFELHTYVNLAQMVHGTALETFEIISLVKTLLHQENLIQKPLRSFMQSFRLFATEGVGFLLQGAAVNLDIYELAHVKTEMEKNIIATQLTFDLAGLAMMGTSFTAPYLGASAAVAGTIGALSVPLAGIGIGVTGLVGAFSQVLDEAKAVGKYFWQIDSAYRNEGYTLKNDEDNPPVMNPLYGAVIKSIDFKNGSIQYGSQFIYRSKHNQNGFNFPSCVIDKNSAINIRERLNYPTQINLSHDWQQTKIWILPFTTKSYFSYNWIHISAVELRHDKEFEILDKIDGEDFFYRFYHFPSGYIIYELFEEQVETSITLVLNGEERIFLVPKFSEQDFSYSCLHYNFRAENVSVSGQCTIVLNKIGSLELYSQGSYTWTLSAQELADDTLVFVENGVQIGDIPIKIQPQAPADYFFIDKQGNSFQLNIEQKSLDIESLNFKYLEDHQLSVKRYLEKHALSANHTLLITDYPMIDPKGLSYQGKAYYLPKEDRYVFTQHLDKELSDGALLINATSNESYFYHPGKNIVWHSNTENKLDERYLLFEDLNFYDYHNRTETIISAKLNPFTQCIDIIQKLAADIISADDKQATTYKNTYLYYQLNTKDNRLILQTIRLFLNIQEHSYFSDQDSQASRYAHEKFWPSCPQN